MKNSLYNAIANISQSFYDKYVEVNARFRARSGVKTVIVRRELGKCCNWCSQLAGIYNYGEAPDDIYSRHDNCRCMVTVRYEKGTYEDVWSKKEYASQRNARISKEIELRGQMIGSQEARKRSRLINYGSKRVFARDYDEIKTHKLDHFTRNNLYIEDDVTLKSWGIRQIDGQITQAKEVLGLEDVCKAPIVIVRDDKRLAAYNPRTNTLFISSRMADIQNIASLQEGYACSEDPRSTMVHELFHWKDAEEYRASGKIIGSAASGSDYTVYQRNKAIENLLSAGVDIGDYKSLSEISDYALEKAIENDFEEVYTEYRTKIALGG